MKIYILGNGASSHVEDAKPPGNVCQLSSSHSLEKDLTPFVVETFQIHDLAAADFEAFVTFVDSVKIGAKRRDREANRILLRQIREQNEAMGWGGKVRGEDGIIVVEGGQQVRIAEAVAKFPGVKETTVAKKWGPGFEEAVKAVVDLGTKTVYPGEKFALDLSVDGRLPFSVVDVEYAASSKLIDTLAIKGCRIVERDPDRYVRCTLKEDGTFAHYLRYAGFGGLPVGLGGRAVVLFSGGAGSFVAAKDTAGAGMEPRLLYLFTEETPPQHLRRAVALSCLLREHVPVKRFVLSAVDVTEPVESAKKVYAGQALRWAHHKVMAATSSMLAERAMASWVASGLTADDQLMDVLSAYSSEASAAGISFMFPEASKLGQQLANEAGKQAMSKTKRSCWRLAPGPGENCEKDAKEATQTWSRAGLGEVVKKAYSRLFEVDLGRGYVDYFNVMDAFASKVKSIRGSA